MNIRPAVLADNHEIERLAHVLTPATEPEHQSGDALALLLNSDGHRIWVADLGETVVGWLHAYLAVRVGVAPFVEIAGLIVDEQHRSEGIGSMLVAEAIAWAKSVGVTVRVRSNSKRDATHKFYRVQGFKLLKQQHVFEFNL
ncbi:GNAT family N-acetyltransferase [Marinobacter sp. F3R08]|uniref:GNAT family N-acetyltransferase n=1 Tax=Marinobacter sp. F3R08 TaxID=2841559 RepID=UPI001C09B0D0|nr:GNAT family N-acetyltransferase [Marinobacter sp. F3R08]MBU2952740.1 GNAT family N-acetyltransferase [Marinobacter sp. F3R08]